MLKNFKVLFTVPRRNLRGVVQVGEEIETRLLRVAVIGTPNAGKSTLINQLMDRRVCPTSTKVHTTRAKTRAIFTEGDAQIVFLDTPGLVNFRESRKFKLEKTFLKDSRACSQNADLIGVVHDVSNTFTRDRLDIKVIKILEEFNQIPSVLIFNKVDVLTSKRQLLDITRTVTNNSIDGRPILPGHNEDNGNKMDGTKDMSWPFFKEIFMISALTGSGMPEVKKYFMQQAKPGRWLFPQNVWSDQSAQDLIVTCTKAKLLDFLPQEIPYQLRPQIEYFDVSPEGAITTVVLIHCPSAKTAKLVTGVNHGKLKQINDSLRHDLQQTFRNLNVNINVVVKSPEPDTSHK